MVASDRAASSRAGSRSLQKFSHAPHMVRDPRFHRRRDAHGLVEATEIIETSQTQIAAQWFSNFLLEAFVNLVNRRTPILTLKFCLSICEVQILSGSG